MNYLPKRDISGLQEMAKVSSAMNGVIVDSQFRGFDNPTIG